MKKFMVIYDGENICYKTAIPAKNAKQAREYVEKTFNEKVLIVQDITEEFPISSEKVIEA